MYYFYHIIKKEIQAAYTSKYNYKGKKQAILLMLTDKYNRCRHLAVKSLSALFRGITSSNNEDFYCLNCFHSYRTLNKLKRYERVCNNHDYCRTEMPKEHEKKRILTWRNVIKDYIYNLRRFRMSTKKYNPVKIFLKILIQRKRLRINLQDTHGVQYAHLMIQKTNTIFIVERIVLKSFVKI